MSNILQQMADKQIKTREESRKLLHRQTTNKSQMETRVVFKPRTPTVSTSVQMFKDRLTDGKFTLQLNNNRKTLLDDIFNKVSSTIRKDLLEVLLQQLEQEFFRVCSERNLKDLQERYVSYQQTMNKFLKQVLAYIDEQTNQNNNLINTIKEQEQTIHQHQNQYQQLHQQYLSLCNTNQEKCKKSKGDLQKRELYMENLRLKNEVQRIQEKLKLIEHQTNVQYLLLEIEQIKKTSQEKINDLLKENQLKEKQLSKLNLHYQNIKAQYNKLENELKAYSTIYEANRQQLEQINSDQEIKQKLLDKYRETMLMQKEDFDMRMLVYKDQLYIAKKAQDKLQQLQSKLDRFQIEKSKEIEPSQNANYEKEKTGFEKFSDLFSNDKTFIRMNQTELQQEKSRIVQRVGHSIQAMDNYFNSQEIQLEKLNIGYCPFVTFIEHHKKSLETEFVGLQYKKPSLQFLVTCRHILDGYWNSFEMNKIIGFPQYVYSWLMNFKVDMHEKKVKKIDTDASKIDEQIIRFVVDLSNPVLEKNWECITIQEFINDYTSLDELYFFLFVRNLLYRGPEQLAKPCFFEANHYIPLLQAEFVANHILQSYENATLQQVRRVLRDKAVRKIQSKNIDIIDGAFVLRIMLEFYRVERRNRYKMFKLAFGSRCQNISFKQFRIVMVSNYPDISDLELSDMYRQAYSLSGQGVSVDSFFTCASDNGFFIKYLKLQNMMPLPKIVNDQLAYEPECQIFIMISESIKRFMQHQQLLEEVLIELGQEEIYIKLNQLNTLVDSNFTNIQQYYMNFMRNINQYLDMFRSLNYILYSRLYLRDINPQGIEFLKGHEERMKQMNKDNIFGSDNFNKQYLRKEEYLSELDIIKSQLENIEHITNFLEVRDRQRKQIEMSKGLASKRIQKFMRKKMNKFYSFVSSLLSAKFKSNFKQSNNNK